MLNRRVWTRQPQIGTRLDKAHPLYGAVVGYTNAGFSFRKDGRFLTGPPPSAITKSGPAGISSGFYSINAFPEVEGVGKFSMFTLMDGQSDQTNGEYTWNLWFGSYESDTVNCAVGMGRGTNTSLHYLIFRGNSGSWNAGSPQRSSTIPQKPVGIYQDWNWNTSGQSNVYIDNVFAYGDTFSGSWNSGSGKYWYGLNSYCSYIFNRQLTESERRLLQDNCWALFAPLSRPIFAPSAAAANIYTLSSATYAPGSITATGVTPRVSVAVS